jgi:hypothetical protein
MSVSASGRQRRELQGVDQLHAILLAPIPLAESRDHDVGRITVRTIRAGDRAAETVRVLIPLEVDRAVRRLIDQFGAETGTAELAADATGMTDRIRTAVLVISGQDPVLGGCRLGCHKLRGK